MEEDSNSNNMIKIYVFLKEIQEKEEKEEKKAKEEEG